ncbi:MAG: hypothetical protein II992_07160 [Lachnospiraceae bacterium]|nr:hypothetical protein [Lachnospiraceae bacterium]
MNREAGVEVKVDVTKIVKYACIAATVIIGIIFGGKCISAYIEKNSKVE